MRVLLILDWPAEGRWIWDSIPGNTDTVNLVKMPAPPDRYPGYGKFLGYYQRYVGLAVRAWPQMRNHDVIVAWEGKNGLPLAFLRRIARRYRPPLVILNLVLKSRPVQDFMAPIRYAMGAVNLVTCVSRREVEGYPRRLGLPADRFAVLPPPLRDYYGRQNARLERPSHILAAGRSHRDYATLGEAVRGLPVQVIINARPFNVAGHAFPPNVTINPFLPNSQFKDLLLGAGFAVLPLYPANHASGETFLLEAMSASRAVIATETASTVEFIRPGENGLLVPPGDAARMREAICYLWERPDLANEMGHKAREDYEANWSFPVVGARIQQLLSRLVQTA